MATYAEPWLTLRLTAQQIILTSWRRQPAQERPKDLDEVGTDFFAPPLSRDGSPISTQLLATEA